VLAVADEALATGRRVVLLHGAASSSEVYPTSLLADEVEYVVATRDGSLGHEGEVAEMVADYEAWADRCIASGPPAMLAALASRSRGRDARLGVARLGRKGGQRSTRSDGARARRGSWLQVVVEHPFGCALGVCLGCVVPGVLEPRACREGPAFAAAELAWERAW
jgi:NAD(P)H-flavin reductase